MMAFLNVALVITLLVFWLMDKPFHFAKVDALNTDTDTAIKETEYFAQFTRAFKQETEKIKSGGK
jgi:hypothetical protein